MSNTKKPNANRNPAIPILCGVLAVLVIVMVVALCRPQKPEFVPPAFDTAAVQGVPQVDEALVYKELYQDGMAYRISVCWVPAATGQSLTVYFTNPQSNTKNLKLRVYDESGNILGETGLIKPGEYIEKVALTKALSPGTNIRLKAMGYEPDTFESAGAFSMNFTTQ